MMMKNKNGMYLLFIYNNCLRTFICVEIHTLLRITLHILMFSWLMMISWEGWSGWLLCISHFTFHLPGKVAGWKCKLENLRIFERGTHSSSQLACYPVCGCEMSSFLRVYTYAVVNIVVLDEWIWREKRIWLTWTYH